jgi:hypothetical protein
MNDRIKLNRQQGNIPLISNPLLANSPQANHPNLDRSSTQTNSSHDLSRIAPFYQAKLTIDRSVDTAEPVADKVAQPANDSGDNSQQQAATLQHQSISNLVQRDDLPAADAVVEPLTKAEVQTAKAFYLIHKRRYSATIIKQIQTEVSTEPTGSIDDETIQAVAKFQQANPPLKVDGQAGPRTLPAAFPDGLAKTTSIDTYVGEAKQVEADWVKLNTTNERADALLKSVNTQLKAANVPICNKSVKDLGPAFGQLDFATWTLELGQEAFSQPTVTKEQAADIADTVYHEARHAEQWYRMAQFLAGKKKTAKQIATEMGILANIAKEAHDHPIKAGSMEAVIAEGWYESVYGAKADYRDRVLTDVLAKATAAKKAQAQFDKSPTPANQKKLDLANEKFRKAHQKYKDLPEEADAGRVGGAVEDAYKK